MSDTSITEIYHGMSLTVLYIMAVLFVQKTPDLSQVTDKLHHVKLHIEYT